MSGRANGNQEAPRDFDWTDEEVLHVLSYLQDQYAAGAQKDAFTAALRLQSPGVTGLSDKLRALDIHPRSERMENFRNTNSIRRKAFNLLANAPALRPKKVVMRVAHGELWARYWLDPSGVTERIAAITAAQRYLGDLTADDEEETIEEGSFVMRAHRHRERARGLRARVLKRERAAGAVACAACLREASSFDPDPSVAEAAFEAHHSAPLGARPDQRTRTLLAEVVLLCATCHRLLHARLRAAENASDNLRTDGW